MADGPNYQNVKRAVVVPLFVSPKPEDTISSMQKAYSQLAQEVINCHNRVFSVQAVIPALAANAVVILPAPFPDTNYSPVVILDWAAFGYLTAITAAQFTVTFSVAAPAVVGGIMRILVIR